MPGLIAIVLLCVPLVELWFILQVADKIGVWETVLSLVVVAALGTWLLVREGRATWGRLRSAIARGEMPTGELTDGAAILVGGALLLTPGFLTDAIGLFLVFPPTRAVATRGLRHGFRWWIGSRLSGKSRAGRVIYETTARDVRRRRATRPGPEQPAPRLPSSPRPDDEDDSPDKA